MNQTQTEEKTGLLIPIKVEAKEFYADRTDRALKGLIDQGYKAIYMPQLADARIDAGKESEIFKKWYTTPSIRATGRTKQGKAVVVYAHTDNYFSDPKNITEAITKGLVNGAGIMPREDFQRLLDMEGTKDESGNQLVYIVDYKDLRNSESGVISVKAALKHPQTIPFLGGKERAERYLEKHRQVYREKIGIWHSDDLTDEPMGRLLFAGNSINYILSGDNHLDGNGRFLGVRAENLGTTISKPSLEQVLNVISGYVPNIVRNEVDKRLEKLFK